jgi:Na+/phosphate symporter
MQIITTYKIELTNISKQVRHISELNEREVERERLVERERKTEIIEIHKHCSINPQTLLY